MSTAKSTLLRFLPRSLTNLAASLKLIGSGDYLTLRRRLEANERQARQLALHLLRQNADPSTFVLDNRHAPLNQHELSVYSQNGEDGILLYLFALVGVQTRRFVEFGIGNGRQCNTANLALNFGWSGLLMEADRQQAAAAQAFYQQQLGPGQTAVQIIPARVTAENINDLLTKYLAAHPINSDIDLLSIDIDGNDYWVWQAIHVVQPVVVVIEYNPTFGREAALTIPYDPTFNRFTSHPTGFYHGASLAALARCGQKKGYVLVGCDSSGTNAFLVRQDKAAGKITAIPPAEAYFPGYYRSLTLSQEAQFAHIAHLPLVEV